MNSSARCSLDKTQKLKDYTYYTATKSLCGICKTQINAKILFKDGKVILDKFCPEHGKQQCLISSSVDWYLDCLTYLSPHDPPIEVRTETKNGCPEDCGPCKSHRQKCYLSIIPITSACNQNCPVCYTINKNENPYQLSKIGMQKILDRIVEDEVDLDIINFTGGEPTLHPDLPEFLKMCKDTGIKRLTVSSNCITLQDEDYVKELAKLDARLIISFDTFRSETDKKLLGRDTVAMKTKVLDLLAKHNVCTTILPAVGKGLNDDEVGALFDLVMERPNILSLEVHTVAFTGQGGTSFSRDARITIPDIHRRLEESTGGKILSSDFVPSPLAHPLCYSICHVLCLDDGGYVPFTRFMPRETVYDLLKDSLYLEPRERMENAFRESINHLWANPEELPESEDILRTIKRLLNEMFPADRQIPIDERQKIAEKSAKVIYIHAHMDEETFDVSRVARCCIAVPDEDGRYVPTCAYNVLYRERDPRFCSPEANEKINAKRPAVAEIMKE